MEILTKLQENSRKHHDEIFTRLFRYLLRPDIYFIAYQHLYANDGAGTKGVDEDTADGFSEAYVERIIEALRTETYRPKPVRRTYIQKSNGKMRPLGLPTFTDKLVQEVMRMILAAAVLPFILHKVGDGRSGPAGKQLLEALQFRVHSRHFIFVHFYTLIRQPPGFRNGGAVTSQSGKGRELRRTVMEGHSRMFWRIRMGQMDNVFIFSAQALCPPICLFRSLAVAPSR